MNAAMKGDEEAVMLLLLAGADKELTSAFGPASQLARKNNHDDIAFMIDNF